MKPFPLDRLVTSFPFFFGGRFKAKFRMSVLFVISQDLLFVSHLRQQIGAFGPTLAHLV